MKLKTKIQSAAVEMVKAFIDEARAANPFGEVVWDKIFWEVSNKARASSGRKTERIWFHANFVKKVTEATAEQFPAPFNDFVRAYICHIEGRKQKGVATLYHNTIVRAFRYLHRAFRDGGSNPWELLPMHFDSAINDCQGVEERSSAYRVGNILERIAKTMDMRRMCAVRLNWTSPIPRTSADGGSRQARLGKEFTETRNKMLLSERIVTALGRISNRHDLRDSDLVRQRAIELLMCGGFRVSELLTLAFDCWIEEPQTDDYGQPMVGQNGAPACRYGIRYVPAKGGHEETRIKWLPSVMADVAKRAITDICRLSQPYRDSAHFMAENPGRALLPEPLHSKPDEYLLTLEEIYIAVGLQSKEKERNSARNFVENAALTLVRASVEGRTVDTVRKSELLRYLVGRSGRETVFPEGQAHYPLRECLFVFGVNYFHSTRPTLNGTAALLTDGQIRDYLVGRAGIDSVFERLNYREEDGSKLKVTSHKFRHWLNTMAEDGGMSELEMARWFGRKDIGQNIAYKHMTGLQLATSIHEKRMQGSVKGPVTEAAMKIRNPIRKAEFVVSSTVTAHITDIGVCEHNWAALPCDKHRECITCDEHLLEKGNREHISRTQDLKQHAELSLDLARQEANDGTAGANNWLEHQKVVLERANAALAVHADDSVPDGTLVQLPSHKRVGDTDGDHA